MNSTNWDDRLRETASGLLDGFLEYLPQLFGALALLAVGWAVAAVLRLLTRRTLVGVGRVLPRVVPGRMGRRWRQVLHPGLFASLVFWAVILVFAAAAAQVLGIELFSVWIDALFRHLPLILLAILILAVGGVISQLVRESVVGAAAASGVEYRVLLGYAIQATIVAMAAAIALDLVGLDITFLVMLVAILIAAVSAGAALAFGLGARTVVDNLLGVRSIQHRIREGDRIRIAGLEGQVAELGRRVVIIETAEGRVMIPGHCFSDSPCVILMPEDDRG